MRDDVAKLCDVGVLHLRHSGQIADLGHQFHRHSNLFALDRHLRQILQRSEAIAAPVGKRRVFVGSAYCRGGRAHPRRLVYAVDGRGDEQDGGTWTELRAVQHFDVRVSALSCEAGDRDPLCGEHAVALERGDDCVQWILVHVCAAGARCLGRHPEWRWNGFGLDAVGVVRGLSQKIRCARKLGRVRARRTRIPFRAYGLSRSVSGSEPRGTLHALVVGGSMP
mmetsp:Transcript_46215/g.148383  ORF Transcript_46215/g.148383 Transcript_46215/m.148383 type:complete len:223 (+) Transcript_46215:193-861(+)